MGLMKGSLHSLLDGKKVPDEHLNSTANLVLTHMLQALVSTHLDRKNEITFSNVFILFQDCVASMGIVHRDVKPENILYTHGPDGQPVFKLGDFGVCNQVAQAQTQMGTPIYMAPEIWSGTGAQTPKADIWSLFVVLVWMYDCRGFRREAYGNPGFSASMVAQRAEEAAAPGQRLGQLAGMARRDPERRASAAQMMLLLGLFSQEPRAILCSHGKDPRRIPALPADEQPPPVSPPPSKLAGQRSRGIHTGHASVQSMVLD